MRRNLFILVVALGACGGGNKAPEKNDAGVSDAPPSSGPDASCFTNPQTHNEIINACTSAQQIFKDSHPPLLNSDGSLPALPP